MVNDNTLAQRLTLLVEQDFETIDGFVPKKMNDGWV